MEKIGCKKEYVDGFGTNSKGVFKLSSLLTLNVYLTIINSNYIIINRGKIRYNRNIIVLVVLSFEPLHGHTLTTKYNLLR
jgi:hypothetical protein